MVKKYVLVVMVLVLSVPALGGDRATPTWLDSCLAAADPAPAAPAPAGGADKLDRDNYPLPGHTLDGVGGGMFVPSAYLVNPGPKGEPFGKPAISARYTDLKKKKNVVTVAVTETLFGRVEVGYALNRLNLGSLGHDVQAAFGGGGRMGHRNVHVHNFNIRGLIVEEDSFDLPLPAVTVGASYKYNDSIRSANGRLGVPLDGWGYERSSGWIFTVHATKMIELDGLAEAIGVAELPPVVGTVGVRNSEASYNGFVGFTDHRATTFEASVTTFVAEWIAVSYEFKRNQRAFNKMPPFAIPLFRGEENWHGLGFAFILSENLTINAGIGWLGNISNTEADGAWGVQAKWEF